MRFQLKSNMIVAVPNGHQVSTLNLHDAYIIQNRRKLHACVAKLPTLPLFKSSRPTHADDMGRVCCISGKVKLTQLMVPLLIAWQGGYWPISKIYHTVRQVVYGKIQ